MTRNRYANRGKVAGILLLVYGAFLILSGIISVAGDAGLSGVLSLMIAFGMIFWGVTLVIGKRDALPVVGAIVLAVLQLISQFLQLANNGVNGLSVLAMLLWMAAFIFLALVMAGGLLPQASGMRSLAKGAWFLPAILIGVNELLALIGVLVLFGRYGRYMSGAQVVGTLIGVVFGTVMWVFTMLFSCQWAALGEGTEQKALPQQSYQPQQYQGYQPQQYQGYQPQQYQGYQPQQYQGYQPQQYQGYQPQQYQGYQQPANPTDGQSEG